MKKLLMGTAVSAFLAIGISGVTFAHNDASQCSLRTLRGRYVFSASGFMIDPATGAALPKAIVEVIDFNGDGTLAVPGATRSLNGVITRSPFGVGTYTVTEDCAGTLPFAGPTFDIFISPRGNQFWLIQTNPNSVFQGSATRTSPEEPEQDRH